MLASVQDPVKINGLEKRIAVHKHPDGRAGSPHGRIVLDLLRRLRRRYETNLIVVAS